MATYTAPARSEARSPLAENRRRDGWWIQPLAMAVIFTIFVIYSTFRAFEGRYFETFEVWNLTRVFGADRAPLYLSPFYSPHIPFKMKIGSYPVSAALYVLIFPLSFRLTCYYCRRSFYRAFLGDPSACAVPEVLKRKNYTGEQKVPTVLFNLHRFALYAALVLVCFHWRHLYDAFHYFDRAGVEHVGMGVGTLFFAFDTLMLTAYVFSCHSLRHLVGGVINRFSSARTRYKLWSGVTALNARHGLFFWLSLATVGLADLYVRLLSAGLISDFHVF